MARRKKNNAEQPTYNYAKQEANGSVGLSAAAQKALNAGTYGSSIGKSRAHSMDAQSQAYVANPVPMLKGMEDNDVWESRLSSNNLKPAEVPQDDKYVVKRNRYSSLMKNADLANDIKTLAEVNYKNANTDATVSQEWADEYGAKKITGGYSKSEFLKNLSNKYKLTPEELNDMAFTFHSDANKAESEAYRQDLEKAGKDHSILGSLGSFVGTLGSGIEGAYNTVVGGLTGDDRFLSNIFQNTKSGLREGVKQNIKSNVGKGVYDVGMGIGDMAVGAAAGSAPAILAGNTANDAMSSALARGSSVRKASVYGAGAGALDFYLNKKGLDKAKDLAVDSIKKSGIKELLKKSAVAGLGEAKENVYQDLGQSFLDRLLNDERSELRLSYNDKIARGMSDAEAFKETAKEYASQVALSAGIGFGMGSAMQAGSSIMSSRVPELTNPVNVQETNAAVPEVSALDPYRVPEGWTVDDLENATRDISNVAKSDITPSIHNADGKLLDTVKVPEYTADSNVFFEGTDADISLAEAQDKSITDTFKNIVSDPEFNALSFKNGKQEVYVSPSTSGNGYRMSYTIDGVPTGHHDYSVGELDALSQNLRELAGNGGEDIRIQRKSDISRTQGTAPVEVDPENVIYHSGRLSRLNKADSAGKMEGSRDTGYFGTGHYFVDQASRGEIGKGTSYGNKPYSSVDISKYNNLMRVDTDAKANKLHDFSQKLMRYVNKYNDRYYSEDGQIAPDRLTEYMDDMYKSYSELFGDKAMSRDQFEARLNDFRNNYEHDLYDRGDSAFTTFMKEHGYNGVDSRGTRSAGTDRGVVIYDLDEDSILQSNVTDEATKSGLMNTKVRDGSPLFDEELDNEIRSKIKSQETQKAIRQEYRNLYDETRLKSLQDAVNDAQENINRLENDTIAYYERILNDDDYVRSEAERLNAEFEQFGLPGEDVESIIADKRASATEGLNEARAELKEAKKALADLQKGYKSEEAKSEQAYKQARANIEGRQPQAQPETQPKVQSQTDLETRRSDAKKALKDRRKAIKEQYQKYKDATNKKTRKAEYQKYEQMRKAVPKMEYELRNLDRQINGLAPISDRSMVAIDAYKSDLRKVGNMYAGENGKALAKEAIDALDKYEKSGVNTDFWDFAKKVQALKDASTEVYTSKDGTRSVYETWHNDEDGSELIQQIMPPEDGHQPSLMWGAIGEILKKAETEKAPVETVAAPVEAEAPVENVNTVPEVTEAPTIPNEPVPEVGDKVSQTYTNTGKNGGGWNEAEYDKYTDPDMYRYESIDEVESVQRASQMRHDEGREAFKERVLNKERASSVEIDGLMMEWGDTVEEARNRELAGEDASDLWRESNRIFRAIQKQSTSNAQALQALAKWSRNTPEGMLMHAENVINGRTKIEKTALQKMIDKFEKRGKDFEFSDEFAEQFLREAESLRNLTGDQLETREAKEQMAKLGRMISSQRPSGLSEKVMSFLMDNMLGNFRTLITRNAGGNIGLNAVEQIAQRPLAALIDKAVSAKTGKRTQAGLTAQGLGEYIQGFTKGIKEEVADYKSNLHTARSGENTIDNAISSNRHVFKENGVMDKLDKLVKHGLSVGDRPFYEAVYNQTLGDYNRLRAQGVMGDTLQNLSDAQFNDYAKTAARLNALSAVYQQDSKLSQALLEFKGAVGDLSKGILGVDVLSQFSMPFVKTPANVIERAIDYSPLGFVRNAFRTKNEISNGSFDQNRFANETARNVLGTALMGGAAAAANAGALSGSYSDDKDEKQAQVESGMQEYALNLPGGRQMDISWIPVVGSNTVASAAAIDAINKGEGGFGENVLTGLKAGGQAMFDQSMFQGLQRLFGTGESYNSDEGIVGNMANVVKQGFGQAIPSLVRQGAQVLDPYQRDVANSNEGMSFAGMDNYDINSLIKNLPELRENMLAPKVNTSGDLMMENQGRSFGSKVLEDMILPGKVTEIQTNKLAQEAARISALTDESKAYMPRAARKYVDTEDHTLTNQEWTDYQQRYYKELNLAGETILDLDNYKNADATVQQDTLDKAYSAIRSGINSEYTGKAVTGAAKRYVEAGGGKRGIKAVVDYYNDKIDADRLGMTVDAYRKRQNEYEGGAEAWAQDQQMALDTGFVDKKGNANVDAYNKAMDIVGDDPTALNAYQDYQAQEFSYMDDKVPYVMNNDAFDDAQRGMMITGKTDPSKLEGAGVTGAYNTEGWEGVYHWYLMKYLADNEFGDGNGSVKKAEKEALLNSDNPYVTSLSDEMYYYLAGLPNKAW